MTNRDRLISLLGFQPTNNAIDGALLDAGIEGAANYEAGNTTGLKTAAIEIMETLLTTADSTNTEGMLIRYDRKAVEARIRQYKIDIGIIVEEGPIITSKRLW